MISSLFGEPAIPMGIPVPRKQQMAPKMDPFSNFEVVLNGRKVNDPKEIEKDKKMFENVFDGFDFNFNPLNVVKDIHKMNSQIEDKYKLKDKPQPVEKKMDPMGGLENLFSDLFGSVENLFKNPNSFQKDLDKQKKKEKELKNLHDSMQKRNYIQSYQSPEKDFGEIRVISDLDDENKGEDLLKKINDTLTSAEDAEKSINIESAVQGIKNGLDDLENLKRLNEEENKDIVGVLNGLKNQYRQVNKLTHSLKKDFEKVSKMKKDLKELSAGKIRKKKEQHIENMETKLKNNKGNSLLHLIIFCQVTERKTTKGN